MVQRYVWSFAEKFGLGLFLNDKGDYVKYTDYQELEAENQKLREQRDAANAVIQTLNRIIAGDVE